MGMPAANEPLPPRHAAIVVALRRCRMFSDLSGKEIDALAQGCVPKSLEKGETLFREGDVSEGFYVLHSGAVSAYKLTPDGREQAICLFRPPDSFAEATLATVETYPANTVALEPSLVILVKKAHFLDLIRKRPELSLQMLSSMSLHLKFLVQSLQDIKGRQIEFRLADWLLQQSPGASIGCPTLFELPISKKSLAGQLGVTSETLSRTFARFRKEGLIRVEGAKISIVSPTGLRAYVDA